MKIKLFFVVFFFTTNLLPNCHELIRKTYEKIIEFSSPESYKQGTPHPSSATLAKTITEYSSTTAEKPSAVQKILGGLSNFGNEYFLFRGIFLNKYDINNNKINLSKEITEFFESGLKISDSGAYLSHPAAGAGMNFSPLSGATQNTVSNGIFFSISKSTAIEYSFNAQPKKTEGYQIIFSFNGRKKVENDRTVIEVVTGSYRQVTQAIEGKYIQAIYVYDKTKKLLQRYKNPFLN